MSSFQVRLVLDEQFIRHVESRHFRAVLGANVRQTLYDVGELSDGHEHDAAEKSIGSVNASRKGGGIGRVQGIDVPQVE